MQELVHVRAGSANTLDGEPLLGVSCSRTLHPPVGGLIGEKKKVRRVVQRCIRNGWNHSTGYDWSCLTFANIS
ncbi:hypothetical protein CGMCC3_g1655 [Colletotrichum fructicola]|nr:uncharacterized protein CGMCC3_g1655 [Colletotrichum fructicola]KAE9582394.1 hypothetical protein CGMCC3_g1655 [Colletotrichum fructicola]